MLLASPSVPSEQSPMHSNPVSAMRSDGISAENDRMLFNIGLWNSFKGKGYHIIEGI